MSQASDQHPSANEIVAFANGELSPADEARVNAHTAGCERCAEVKAAVLEFKKKCQAGAGQPVAGAASEARAQSERLPLSPEHESLLTKLASPASLKTLAGELHVSVARLRRQVREVREFICDHNPRLMQKSYRALEASLDTDDEAGAASPAASKPVSLDGIDRTASEEYLSRHFGAVNVGIHRAVYSADDDAEWERVLQSLLSGVLTPRVADTPVETAAAVSTAPAPEPTEEMEWSSADGLAHASVTRRDGECRYRFTHTDRTLSGTTAQVSVSGQTHTITWMDDADCSCVRADLDLHEHVERPMEIDLSREMQSAGRVRRARGRR